ncbi:MAG: histidine--tRNA ligase [Actinobacteria bacterium]|uniref:Histidine--tRNA ligase n=1 Tax=Phycicoccus elongatus Lp2 TaxID=1193181 RepID=N0E412_9MICO|nr:histidine--tRNA ligase [Phycicoccus elongatus]MCA0322720.1 histidine--tRNA ligase [Actinomycetota bacterium]CCH70530.1 Histidyl-tRNA synthetase [Phycicoccus elongatus Lp2]
MATKITPISGFPELLPRERFAEQHVLDVVRRTFELHGYAGIETRAVEPVERLVGKGGDADKEIYAVSRLAGGEDARDASLGLHFDLTVPFARYVLENAGKLDFPFRRYQIQKSWRGERPQEGRFREFTQADIDVVDIGSLPAHFEAEMPIVLAEIFEQLPVGDFRVRCNNRKIPQGFYLGIGLTDIVTTLRIVDKLDKVGAAGVRAMLVEAGATAQQAEQCLALAEISTADGGFVDQVRALGVDHPLLQEGLQTLAEVMSAASAATRPGRVVADLSVARGLDYYTGTVYETQLVGFESWGSVAGGGRYDALASDGATTYPGVGISVGITRLVQLLIARRGLTTTRSTPSAVLVAVTDDAGRPRSAAVATALRARGIPCEVAPKADRFGKQIRYADRRGIPYVWFPGTGDDDGDQVKDIRSGAQVPAQAQTWTCPDEDLRPALRTD